MSFLLASFPLHRHRKSNSRWRRPLAHLPRLFLFAWTFSATFCGPWASLIDLVRISKISHDCTLTPTSKFERRYGKSNDNFAFTNLRVVASHVQKAVYSGSRRIICRLRGSLCLFHVNCHSPIVRENWFLCGVSWGVIIPSIISLLLDAAEIIFSLFFESKK